MAMKSHRLFVRFTNTPDRWTEVEQINLGSARKPNDDVLEIYLKPNSKTEPGIFSS